MHELVNALEVADAGSAHVQLAIEGAPLSVVLTPRDLSVGVFDLQVLHGFNDGKHILVPFEDDLLLGGEAQNVVNILYHCYFIIISALTETCN